MKFLDKKHEEFFCDYILKCRKNDSYNQALIYLLGATEDTRNHIKEIFDFDYGYVNPDCLNADWITSTTARLIRFAFNMYNCGAPSCNNIEDDKKRCDELFNYLPSNFFYCELAPCYWEALKIRYPQTCYEL